MRDPAVLRLVQASQRGVVRYVFNYNVLEALSIISATCILLAGMVFSSEAFGQGSTGYWVLVVGIAVLITGAAVVMLVLVAFEVRR